MAKKQQEYGNDSIRQLKGADRVRKRPAVIFGSDGVEGCAHSIFEIISNSIDEARDGHGNRINVTLFPDHVVEVEDFGRGIPVDYNKAEERWNWDLVFCELYAGGSRSRGIGSDSSYNGKKPPPCASVGSKAMWTDTGSRSVSGFSTIDTPYSRRRRRHSSSPPKGTFNMRYR